ncbi:MAG: molybdenum cofactor guanylyltransferase [Spirochaetia bacterium]
MERIVGGVLAGGGSRRYGRDKAFVEWKGRSLVEYALQNVSRLAEETYILSKEPKKFVHLPWTVIPDITTTPTPISGILSISPFVKDWLLVAACDILVLDPEFINTLWGAREPGKAVIPRTDRGLQPLLAIYPKEVLGYWEQAYRSGNFKLRSVVENMPRTEVDISKLRASSSSEARETRGEQGLPPFRNINRPEDLPEVISVY